MASQSLKNTRTAQNTKRQFLSAAEDVFCEHGYEGSTIRAIAKKAGANLGALQYYWGGKKELFRDLFERRFRPLHEAHLQELRAIEEATPDTERPDIESLIRALVNLTLATGSEQALDQSKRPSHKFYGRAMTEPSLFVLHEMNLIFGESINLFIKLMRRACPELQTAELDWRLNCIIGAHLFTLIHNVRMQNFFDTDTNIDQQTAGEFVIRFLMHGITAPTTSTPIPPLTKKT